MTSSLPIGWILDLLFGDPEQLPHPIVYFGKWISYWEHRLNKGENRKMKGAVFAVATIALVFMLSFFIFYIIPWLVQNYALTAIASKVVTIICTLLSVLAIFFCLAGHTLRKEVRMVFEAVDRSTEEGRTQVARIVGRDTTQLTPQEIRTAALETLAENLSDGVIAPLFWLAVLGVPGMLTYKMINTLDSMIGYHSERYKDFGCWAAKIDDAANFLPARITALLMILSAPLLGKRELKKYASFTTHFGPQHASPNSGWPEAALAGILDCRFGGPHNYFGEYFYKPFIGTNPRPLTTADMDTSIKLCFTAECIAVVVILILSYIF